MTLACPGHARHDVSIQGLCACPSWMSDPSVRSPAGREERQSYYQKCDIAYIARPGHNVNGYTRAGRFKKASNMNFCLGVSRRVSALMQVCWSACYVAQAVEAQRTV